MDRLHSLKLQFFLLMGLTDRMQNRQRLSSRTDQGFTLIEVIVAVVILSVFILASLTALVSGLNLKIKAKLNNEATLLIQQDLERVRYVAANSNITTVAGTLPTALIVSPVITVTLPINLIDGKNTLSNASENAILKAGTETTGYTLAIVPTSTDTSIAVKVDVTKTIKTTKLIDPSLTTSPNIKVSDVTRFAIGQTVLIGSSTSSTVFVGKIANIDINGKIITFSSNVNAAYVANTAVTILPSVVNNVADTIADISICPGTNNIIARRSMAAFSSVSLASIFPPNPSVTPNPNVTTTTTVLVLAGNPDKTATTTTTVAQVGFNGRNYQITRTAKEAPEPTTNDPTASNPRNFSNLKVQLTYAVIDKAVTSSTTLAELTTEVIPDVIFQCS